MEPSLLYSLGICGLSVALEALFAGGGIKQRLAELRVPSFTPSLPVWIIIGLSYYLICFIVLWRVFALPAGAPWRTGALLVLGGIMFLNALWNYFFFRSRNLRHAFLIGLPYAVLALALFGMLLRLDRVAAWVFLPYALYLVYAGRFGYRIWQLNPLRGQ